MTEQDYTELNNYMNDVFLKLEEKDYFFLENIEMIKYLGDRYCDIIEKFDLKDNKKENNISFNEVYLLAREVIESINPNYLQDFDNLISTGELDFDYEDKYFDSHLTKLNNEEYTRLINVKRTYNYEEVKTLVHEFFHYTNITKNSIKRYLLGEYISISSEIYAEEYMVNKGIDRNEMSSKFRLKTTYDRYCDISWVIDALIIYKNIGNLNKKDIGFIQENITDIEPDEFEAQCKRLLHFFRTNNDKYNPDQPDLKVEYDEHFSVMCQYLLGTLLAFYTKDHVDKKDFVYINDHINDDNGLFIIDTLQNSGIDLEKEDTILKIFESIENYLNSFDYKKVIK